MLPTASPRPSTPSATDLNASPTASNRWWNRLWSRAITTIAAPAAELAVPTAITDPQPGSPESTVVTSDERTAWRRALGVGLLAFLVSRLCVLIGAGVRAAQLRLTAVERGEPYNSMGHDVAGVFTQWDGLWYLRIVREGYPRFIPPGITYEQTEARAAFFPLYPTLVRWLDVVLPGGDTVAALFLNFVLSLVAVYLVGVMARRLFGLEVAERAMVLFCVFPGSFVLSYAYSEAALIVLSAACLLLLMDRRWVLAGLAAAAATAARPNGIAVVVACAVAAVLAIRERREWKALIAPLLAPVGYVGFQLWLAQHTGESMPWWRVQREAWKEGWSFGWAAIWRIGDFVGRPFASPTSAITVATLAVMVLGLWAMWRRRLPLPVAAYVLVIIGLMLLPSTVTARPRFLFTAFPIFIAIAAWLPRKRSVAFDLLMVGCGAGLVGLTTMYAVAGAVP